MNTAEQSTQSWSNPDEAAMEKMSVFEFADLVEDDAEVVQQALGEMQDDLGDTPDGDMTEREWWHELLCRVVER